MRGANVIRIFSLSVAIGLILVAYNNCGSHTGYKQLTVEEQSVCEDDLQKVFEDTYRPFLADPTSCGSCHAEGGESPYKFAAADVEIAYSFFLQVGAEQIGLNAADPTHAPGITGPAKKATVDSLKIFWDQGEETHLACATRGTSGTDAAFKVIAKPAETIYFSDNKVQALVWTLNFPDDILSGMPSVPATFVIDVSIKYVDIAGVKTAVGYTFANPRIAMLTGEVEIEVEGLFIKLNDIILTDLPAFASITGKIARGIDPLILQTGGQTATLDSLSNMDKFSASFKSFTVRARTDNPPIPPTPTLTISNPLTRQTSFNLTVGGDTNIRRWCLTTNPVRPASASEACTGQLGNVGSINGWATARPNAFDLLTTGVPVNGQTYTVYLWVANSDLKVNLAPASGTVTFDNVAPAAPSATISLDGNPTTGTQIADLSINSAGDAVSWCVKEAVQGTNFNSDNCQFVNSKPTLVGLTGNGNRSVVVFVRDQAGNISLGSTPANASNPFGRISHTQLIDAVANARAVFRTRCASCHSAGGPNVAELDILNYSGAVAKKTQILSRIDNGSSPMPPTGLLSDKERALIRLWFNQSSTPLN